MVSARVGTASRSSCSRPGTVPGLGPSGVEHRLSYFTDGPSVAITPGQEKLKTDRLDPRNVPLGKPMGPDTVQQCFQCHSTLTSTLEANVLETSTLIPSISCERCHGPARAHTEAARRGQDELTMRMGHDRAGPWVEVNLCGECHRLPRSVSVTIDPARQSRDRPVPGGRGVDVRLLCQRPGRFSLYDLPRSPRPSLERSRPLRVGVRLVPSIGPGQKACPISPAANCVGCHMPRREVPGNGRFTDHWIRKPAPASPAPPKSEAVTTSSTFQSQTHRISR